MARHNDIGKMGELMAAEWLKQQGYSILDLNWRHSYYEIDIVASRNNLLHFIEVKTRNSLAFGHPEESISFNKFGSLMKAAEEYLYQHPSWNRVQYDVLSITNLKDKAVEYFLIEDVYYSKL
jgi:putative endonuclease